MLLRNSRDERKRLVFFAIFFTTLCCWFWEACCMLLLSPIFPLTFFGSFFSLFVTTIITYGFYKRGDTLPGSILSRVCYVFKMWVKWKYMYVYIVAIIWCKVKAKLCLYCLVVNFPRFFMNLLFFKVAEQSEAYASM